MVLINLAGDAIQRSDLQHWREEQSQGETPATSNQKSVNLILERARRYSLVRVREARLGYLERVVAENHSDGWDEGKRDHAATRPG